jgi:putative ABC transport system permease protein
LAGSDHAPGGGSRQRPVCDRRGEGLARALKVNVGDSINLLLNTRDGAMNTLEFDIVGVFRSMSKEYDARGVQIPLVRQRAGRYTGDQAVVVL